MASPPSPIEGSSLQCEKHLQENTEGKKVTAVTGISANLLHDTKKRRGLDDWGPSPDATGQQMDTRGSHLWKDRTDAESGILKCTADLRRVHETNEFIHVLLGPMTQTHDDREPILWALEKRSHPAGLGLGTRTPRDAIKLYMVPWQD